MEETTYRYVLDVEIYDNWGEDKWPQAKYLVHGYDDVLWTNSIEQVLRYIENDLKRLSNDTK